MFETAFHVPLNMPRTKAIAWRDYVASSVLYSVCSSSMLIMNTQVMRFLPYPSLVSIIQFFVSVVFVQVLKLVGWHIDDLEWDKMKGYIIYCISFASSCYANMRVLVSSNVETVMVIRASTPLAVAFFEY